MRHLLRATILYFSFVLTFNEFLIYYLSIYQCKWPQLPAVEGQQQEGHRRDKKVFRMLILSDTHLLGKRHGHWFDKLRREWQMQRGFQTLVHLHQPDAVFILGDLFDEGKWVQDADEWRAYVERADEMFRTPPGVPLHVVVGNHDVGFHYDMTEKKVQRFFDEYQSRHVEVIELKGQITFVLINSMALENDNCIMCDEAANQLDAFALRLHCSKKENAFSTQCQHVEKLSSKSQPILLQHFPLFRHSDATCEGDDSAEFVKDFVEGKDCVSSESSKVLLNKIKPRLVLSGHTHDGCVFEHQGGLKEISVPSFSWRNRNNPSAVMLSATADEWSVSKCYLPVESTVFILYFYEVIFYLWMLCSARCRKKFYLLPQSCRLVLSRYK